MDAIKHLYWRAGFGLSPREWAEKKSWTLRRGIDELFKHSHNAEPLPVPAVNLPAEPGMLPREKIVELQRQERQLVIDHNIAWIERMANPEAPALLERMSLFWHGHFACDIDNSRLAIQYLNTLRTHALGNFRELLLAIAREPAMIRYLNNQQNRKDHPNENFTRELLELFTIGRGNYTENDIKEGARAFTGWSSNLQGAFIFRPGQHDYGRKTFLGKSGNFDGTDIVDLILEKPETAQFLTRKIYRYFVNEQVDESRVRDLAKMFFQSGYDITRLMRFIFESEWFYEKQNQGTRIKSPVELIAGIMRSLHLQFENARGLVLVQRALGQVLFHPPNVAGWPGGRTWIDNSTLMLRLNLPMYILAGADANLRPKDDLQASERAQATRRLEATFDLEPFSAIQRGSNPEQMLPALRNYLLLADSPVEDRLIGQFIQTSDKQVFLAQAIMRIMSLPEYQMC